VADRSCTTLLDVVPEKSTSLLSGSLVDETGAALGSAQLATLTMTLYALTAGLPIINSRTAVNILNAGPGTVDAFGVWTITLEPADNAIQVPGQAAERHCLLLEWTYGGGAKAGKHEVVFTVRNLEKVT